MKVKLEWLKELVDLSGLDDSYIIEKLGLYSIEIESVSKVLSGTNLAIGHVLEKEPHPDSDHLSVCKVDIGSEVLQIVCGAPNVKKDQYVIVALIGAVLPGDFKIKKSKIRGIESSGMICSLKELGMESKYVQEEYQSGIYYFKYPVVVGSNPLEALNLDDNVVELGLTPNRGDLLSMLGVAYEASAVFNRPMKEIVYNYTTIKEDNSDNINISIATNGCSLYYGKVFKDIKIKESPQWLVSRLIAFGIRPINNVVDITNYILALFGQPVHAFDYDLLGNNILVRNAYKDEEIITLDGNKRLLLENDIVITDGKVPVALAGVMGGLDTEITDNTKNILLEVAVFDPKSIRSTYTRLNLRSEASIRYEKGVDANRSKLALDYACYLLQELAEAKVLSGDTYAGNNSICDKEITITEEYIKKHLGIKISKEDIIDIMLRLGFKVDNKSEGIKVLVPNRRFDITIEADLLEEVVRIYGYEHLPITIPASNLSGGLSDYQKKRLALKNTLASLGLEEKINYSLNDENHNKVFTVNHNKDSKDIVLMYPISNDRKYLRMSLVPSLLDNVNYVYNRKIYDVAYFEIGKVYYMLNNETCEEEALAIVMSNNFSSTLWRGQTERVDFYLLKGLINQAFKLLNLEFDYEKLDVLCNELHPTRSAKILFNGEVIGYIGEIHPKYAQDHDLDEVYVCEIKLKNILNIKSETILMKPVSKVPSVERDIAIVVKKEVSASSIIETIKSVDRKTLSDVKIFDLYIGNKIKDDCKSIAIKLKFTAYEVLTDEVVNQKISKILKQLEKEHGAILRA